MGQWLVPQQQPPSSEGSATRRDYARAIADSGTPPPGLRRGDHVAGRRREQARRGLDTQR